MEDEWTEKKIEVGDLPHRAKLLQRELKDSKKLILYARYHAESAPCVVDLVHFDLPLHLAGQ